MAMVSHSWNENEPKVSTCLDLHKRAEELTRHAEEAYRQRDLLVDVKESVLASQMYYWVYTAKLQKYLANMASKWTILPAPPKSKRNVIV
jgi:hypothetical protein